MNLFVISSKRLNNSYYLFTDHTLRHFTRQIMKKLICALFFLIFFTSGIMANNDETISFTGTVTFLEIEGGFYGIVSDDGEKYKPEVLDKEYQKRDLKVQVKAEKKSNSFGIFQWGTIIKIRNIRVLSKK